MNTYYVTAPEIISKSVIRIAVTKIRQNFHVLIKSQVSHCVARAFRRSFVTS